MQHDRTTVAVANRGAPCLLRWRYLRGSRTVAAQRGRRRLRATGGWARNRRSNVRVVRHHRSDIVASLLLLREVALRGCSGGIHTLPGVLGCADALGARLCGVARIGVVRLCGWTREADIIVKRRPRRASRVPAACIARLGGGIRPVRMLLGAGASSKPYRRLVAAPKSSTVCPTGVPAAGAGPVHANGKFSNLNS